MTTWVVGNKQTTDAQIPVTDGPRKVPPTPIHSLDRLLPCNKFNVFFPSGLYMLGTDRFLPCTSSPQTPPALHLACCEIGGLFHGHVYGLLTTSIACPSSPPSAGKRDWVGHCGFSPRNRDRTCHVRLPPLPTTARSVSAKQLDTI